MFSKGVVSCHFVISSTMCEGFGCSVSSPKFIVSLKKKKLIFGCAEHGLSLVAESWGCSLIEVEGFSLQWLLSLQSTGSRVPGFQ